MTIAYEFKIQNDMKKLLMSSALCAATVLSAQVDFSSTRFGLTAGGTYSRVSNAHNPSGARFSVYGGAMALIPVDSNDQFYIQPEVEYLGAGESGKDKNAKIEYVNFLNLPADPETRSCFIAEKGNSWISIDYSGKK